MSMFDGFTVGGDYTPEFLAGVSAGLTMAGQVVVALGSFLNTPCGECDTCRSVSEQDRHTLAEVFRANRQFAAETANACDDLAADVMALARMTGYRPPRRDGRSGGRRG
jgi:hypothetical protein